MKLFENRFFILGILLAFCLILILIGIFGCFIGITEIPNLIASSTLMFLSTFFAIAFPLYAAYKNEEKRTVDETEKVYMTVASYVGGEILDNLIEIQDILAINQKSWDKLESQSFSLPDIEKKRVTASIWKAASETLIDSLEDKYHSSIVMSGLVAKVPDKEIKKGIRETYQKMENLKKRLNRMSKFFNMLLSSQPGVPKSFINYQLSTEVKKAVDAVELDIKIFNASAKRTISKLNKVLVSYDKELKIVKYEDENLRKKTEKVKKSSN